MNKYNSNTNSHFKCEALNREEGYFIQRKHTFKCKDKELHLGTRTFIMGILNVTPDSFYDGGRFLNLDDALIQIDKMMNEGADIIDIGAESTRPGSHGVTEEEELRRVVPIIKEAMKRFDVILSIDTTKPRVAKEALGEGASIINDISGLKFNPEVAQIAAKWGAGLVLMHTSSHPYDMQLKTEYKSFIPDVINSLNRSIEIAESNGVNEKSIIVDPGFGFGKKVEHNFTLLKYLNEFLVLDKPILIGTSRKSFIGRVLGASVEDRIEGTAATVAIGVMNGASIVRVHDVLYMKRVANIVDAVMSASFN
ncbi:MAG: dihydropteroate synthase, dihydropteroate synthase [Candidatus Dadabacteria bacterium CSP1-2]|nr:MAG: dihydropteroate synthase, dihydropteroate synthase [Candidatus Dadabacteria bacterium CSP1-2]